MVNGDFIPDFGGGRTEATALPTEAEFTDNRELLEAAAVNLLPFLIGGPTAAVASRLIPQAGRLPALLRLLLPTAAESSVEVGLQQAGADITDQQIFQNALINTLFGIPGFATDLLRPGAARVGASTITPELVQRTQVRPEAGRVFREADVPLRQVSSATLGDELLQATAQADEIANNFFRKELPDLVSFNQSLDDALATKFMGFEPAPRPGAIGAAETGTELARQRGIIVEPDVILDRGDVALDVVDTAERARALGLDDIGARAAGDTLVGVSGREGIINFLERNINDRLEDVAIESTGALRVKIVRETVDTPQGPKSVLKIRQFGEIQPKAQARIQEEIGVLNTALGDISNATTIGDLLDARAVVDAKTAATAGTARILQPLRRALSDAIHIAEPQVAQVDNAFSRIKDSTNTIKGKAFFPEAARTRSIEKATKGVKGEVLAQNLSGSTLNPAPLRDVESNLTVSAINDVLSLVNSGARSSGEVIEHFSGLNAFDDFGNIVEPQLLETGEKFLDRLAGVAGAEAQSALLGATTKPQIAAQLPVAATTGGAAQQAGLLARISAFAPLTNRSIARTLTRAGRRDLPGVSLLPGVDETGLSLLDAFTRRDIEAGLRPAAAPALNLLLGEDEQGQVIEF